MLGFNLLDQVGTSILIELVALSIQLFLHTLEFVVLALQFILLGLKLLAQSFEIAASFITAENCLFNVNGSHLCTRAYRGGRNRWTGGRASRARGRYDR